MRLAQNPAEGVGAHGDAPSTPAECDPALQGLSTLRSVANLAGLDGRPDLHRTLGTRSTLLVLLLAYVHLHGLLRRVLRLVILDLRVHVSFSDALLPL